MAYATSADVQARIGAIQTIGAGTTPTTTQVSTWLDEYSADVDAVLTAAGYATIPATGTNDLNLLQGRVAQIAAAEAIDVMTGYLGLAPEQSDIEYWRKKWDTFLTDLRSGKMKLIDQGTTGAGSIRMIRASVYGSDD